MRFLRLLLLACLGAGCHNYRPATPVPEPGTRVAAALTESGSVELAGLLGPRVVALDGRVLAASESALVLSVLKTRNRNAEEASWRGETVILPQRTVAIVEERTFSTGRSLLLGGAVMIGAVALYSVFSPGSSTGGAGGGGKPTPR